MPLADLSPEERNVVLQCLRAAAEGPFFPDWEFQTLFGLKREEIKDIADAWPTVNEGDSDVVLAINNTLNNLLGYPHRCEKEWPRFISVPPEHLGNIYCKWRGRRIESYFDGIM